MSAAQLLLLDYVTSSGSRPEDWDGVLGAAAFEGGTYDGGDAAHLRRGGGDVPLAYVRTPVLNDAGAVLEVWRTNGRTEPGSHGQVRYGRGGDLLFGSVAIEEASLAGAGGSDPRTPLEVATDRAYRQMYATLAAADTPHLVRVWNYLPEINIDTYGLERYRQFNTARHAASLACGRAIAGAVPAASALGAASGSPLTIYFLASSRAPAFIENPRQVSAYRYPPQYGPRSPAFSRATVLGKGSAATLFISGTASIVGHQTLHAGDPAAQTRETLVNIEALLAEAARQCDMEALGLETLKYKVYVRDPQELPIIRAGLASALGPKAAPLYLKADICRRELSVEIEAVGGGGSRPAA